MAENTPQTITVDGTEYPLSQFSERVNALVGVHQRWEKEQSDQQIELAKTQAAIRDLTREVLALVQEELKAAVVAA